MLLRGEVEVARARPSGAARRWRSRRGRRARRPAAGSARPSAGRAARRRPRRLRPRAGRSRPSSRRPARAAARTRPRRRAPWRRRRRWLAALRSASAVSAAWIRPRRVSSRPSTVPASGSSPRRARRGVEGVRGLADHSDVVHGSGPGGGGSRGVMAENAARSKPVLRLVRLTGTPPIGPQAAAFTLGFGNGRSALTASSRLPGAAGPGRLAASISLSAAGPDPMALSTSVIRQFFLPASSRAASPDAKSARIAVAVSGVPRGGSAGAAPGVPTPGAGAARPGIPGRRSTLFLARSRRHLALG